MRDRPWSRECPPGPYDVIVIGSGIGGMTCAALLAKTGRRVLVLEQHYVPGGYTHTFSRKGWTWDVGVHAVGEVTQASMPGRILDALTDGELKWATLGESYDQFHFPGGFRIDFPDTPEKFRANLVAAFPGEEQVIDKYIALCRHAVKQFSSYTAARLLPQRTAFFTDALLLRGIRPYLTRTTKEVLDELTPNERLKTVLAGQWGYYGVLPQRSSFVMHALVVKHYFYGGFYPVGGSARIAQTLLGTVAKTGGWTRIVADVQRILVEGGRARGVELKGGERIEAPVVVSAIGAGQTVKYLLPEPLRREDWAVNVEQLKPSAAHVCLYVGFRGDIRTAGAGSANQWFYNTWKHDEEAWPLKFGEKPPPATVLYTSFPSLKDPAFTGDKHTAEVVTFVDYSLFEQWRDKRWRRRGGEYEQFKQAMSDVLLEQLLERLPGLRPMVEYTELSTPLSSEHFVRPARGSIYGLEPTPERYTSKHLRPKSPLPGLYFAGADMAAVGVVGAMMGGVTGATAVAPVDVGRFMARHAGKKR